MPLAQISWNMAAAKLKYLFKVIKRVRVFLIIMLVTYLAVFIMRQEDSETYEIEYFKNNTGLGKFILLWTNPKASPFNYFGKGPSVFRDRSCKYTNCYVTGDREELGDTSLFDVVLFNGPQLLQMLQLNDLPTSRSVNQKYVYANVESSDNYPLCGFNGFFNWTWTYRLDSDVNYGYYVVKNKSGQVIAPKIDVEWENIDAMEDIDENLKEKLKSKTKAVAWFASNCHTKSRREHYVESVQRHLKNYSLNVDVYGACGTLQCPMRFNERCLRLLDKAYYFYFAFENSFSVDYVTEKILNAVRHNTVPVVYGGANYSRFLPPGSYINAFELTPAELAAKINHLIKNPEAYFKYFRWQKYYNFHLRHERPETDDYCKFCELLNSDKMAEESVHMTINEWWSGNYCYTEDALTHYKNVLKNNKKILISRFQQKEITKIQKKTRQFN